MYFYKVDNAVRKHVLNKDKNVGVYNRKKTGAEQSKERLVKRKNDER